MPIFLVYMTVPDATVAFRIAETLIEECLAACVNILPVESVYRWEGKICHGTEKVLIVKTTETRWPELQDRVIELHPYNCPAIMALPVTTGHNPFLAWIEKEVSQEF